MHTTNDVGEILSAACACGWSGALAALTTTNRTMHLRPPSEARIDDETSACGWMGVEMTDDLELVRCRTCRRKARPPKQRVVARPIAGTMHMERERLVGEGLDAHPTLCGATGETTTDAGLVRCKRCRRAMDVDRDLKPDNVVLDPSPDELPFEPGPPVPVKELGGAHTLLERERRVIERVTAGDDPDESPRWRGLDAAIAMWRRVGRDPSPIRSAPLERESRSEGAVRTTFGRDEWIEVDRVIDLAFARPVRIRIGMRSLELSPSEGRAVLRSVFREEMTATQWAADLTEAGRPATRELVAAIIRQGKGEMRTLLEAKGLIERRRTRETGTVEEQGTMGAPHGFDLSGWKEIQPLLGFSEKLARELMQRDVDPLPVKPWFGSVIAKRSELLAWIDREAGVGRTGT